VLHDFGVMCPSMIPLKLSARLEVPYLSSRIEVISHGALGGVGVSVT